MTEDINLNAGSEYQTDDQADDDGLVNSGFENYERCICGAPLTNDLERDTGVCDQCAE